jgi:hypothetical protein
MGIPGRGEFYKEVNFEVHGIVESCKPEKVYVLCGTITVGGRTAGMLAILDENLELKSLRYYEEVKVFYAVHAQDSFYYVCGQMQPDIPYNSTAIVLRDAIAAPMNATDPNMCVFRTNPILYPNCAFHEIALKKVPNQDCPVELSVLGAGKTVSFTLNHFEPIDNPLSVIRAYLLGAFVVPVITKKIQL